MRRDAITEARREWARMTAEQRRSEIDKWEAWLEIFEFRQAMLRYHYDKLDKKRKDPATPSRG